MAADLPGVKAGDVEITFEDGLLTIQGERHSAHDAAGEKVHRAERCYGAFRRSITLPSHVEAGRIEASAQDGVLQILVPKAKEVRPSGSRCMPASLRAPSRPAQWSATAADSKPGRTAGTGPQPREHDPAAVTTGYSGGGRRPCVTVTRAQLRPCQARSTFPSKALSTGVIRCDARRGRAELMPASGLPRRPGRPCCGR